LKKQEENLIDLKQEWYQWQSKRRNAANKWLSLLLASSINHELMQ